MATEDEQKDKKTGDGPIDPAKPVPMTGGHKASIEITFNLRTEADPDSEVVQTFLKSIGDIAKSKGASGGPVKSK